MKLITVLFNLLSKNSVLQDENAGRDGDLYIRSVSFSPDGKFLATGAEDKQIRVSFVKHRQALTEIITCKIRSGILQRREFASFYPDMSKIFTL